MANASPSSPSPATVTATTLALFATTSFISLQLTLRHERSSRHRSRRRRRRRLQDDDDGHLAADHDESTSSYNWRRSRLRHSFDGANFDFEVEEEHFPPPSPARESSNTTPTRISSAPLMRGTTGVVGGGVDLADEDVEFRQEPTLWGLGGTMMRAEESRRRRRHSMGGAAGDGRGGGESMFGDADEKKTDGTAGPWPTSPPAGDHLGKQSSMVFHPKNHNWTHFEGYTADETDVENNSGSGGWCDWMDFADCQSSMRNVVIPARWRSVFQREKKKENDSLTNLPENRGGEEKEEDAMDEMNNNKQRRTSETTELVNNVERGSVHSPQQLQKQTQAASAAMTSPPSSSSSPTSPTSDRMKILLRSISAGLTSAASVSAGDDDGDYASYIQQQVVSDSYAGNEVDAVVPTPSGTVPNSAVQSRRGSFSNGTTGGVGTGSFRGSPTVTTAETYGPGETYLVKVKGGDGEGTGVRPPTTLPSQPRSVPFHRSASDGYLGRSSSQSQQSNSLMASARADYNARIMPSKVVMVRHGQSEGNVNESLYATQPDNAMKLTKLGWDQARMAGKALRESVLSDENQRESVHFIVSPYVRTVETFHGLVSAWCDPSEFDYIKDRDERMRAWYGRLMELGLTWHEDPRIREQDFGNYQDPEKIKKSKRERHKFGVFYYRFANGESASDVFDRVSTFLDSLWRSFDLQRSRNYVLVTHGISIRVLLARYFRYSIDQFNVLANPKNGEMVILGHDGAGKLRLDGRCELELQTSTENGGGGGGGGVVAASSGGRKKKESAGHQKNVVGYKFHKRLRVVPRQLTERRKIRVSFDDEVE